MSLTKSHLQIAKVFHQTFFDVLEKEVIKFKADDGTGKVHEFTAKLIYRSDRHALIRVQGPEEFQLFDVRLQLHVSMDTFKG